MPRFQGVLVEEPKKPRFGGQPIQEATIPAGPISTDIQIPRQTQEPIKIPSGVQLGHVIEPAATVVTGGVAEPVAGLAGIAAAPFTGAGGATEVVENVRQALTFIPRTQKGKVGLEALGKAAEPVGKALKAAEQFTGDIGFDVAGPAGGAIGSTIPTLILSVAGLRAGRGSIAKQGDSALFRRESPAKAAIRKSILENPTDNATARYMINGADKVVKDPAAIEAIKQGMDEGVVAAVKGSNRKDILRMRKMVDTVDKGRANRTFFLQNRPEDVVGQTILERWRAVRDLNKTAGSRLDSVAKTLKGKKVNIDQAVNQFKDDLSELGVSFDGFKPDFGDLSIGEIREAKSFINKVSNTLSKVGNDAHKAHLVKKILSEQVSFGKVGQGLTGRTEGIVKSLRHNIDQALDTNFPRYNKVNTQFSDTISALDAFRDAAGAKNFNPFSPNADKFVGTLSRRLLSNVQSRGRLMDSLDNLQSSAKKYGVKFDDDIMTQAMFADELESVFGSFAPKSLQGQTEKAIIEGARVAREGAVETGARGLAKGVEKLRGINEQNAIKSLKELLKRSLK